MRHSLNRRLSEINFSNVSKSTIKLSQIKCLDISKNRIENLTRLLSDNLPSLSSLILSNCGLNSEDLCSLAQASVEGRLPELTHLDISSNPEICSNKLDISHGLGITGNLSVLLRHSFPSLNSLILSNCGLNSQDLCHLAIASVKGRLPVLRHLDISENKYISDKLDYLFENGCKWEQLNNLNIEQRTIARNDFNSLLNNVESGCLRSIQKLALTTDRLDGIEKHRWTDLSHFSISCTEHSFMKILDRVDKTVQNDMLPKLAELKLIPISSKFHGNLNNSSCSPSVLDRTKEILQSVKNESLSQEALVNFLTDLAAEKLDTTEQKELLNDESFKSLLRCLMESTDLEALFRDFADGTTVSDHPTLRLLADHMSTLMEPYLEDFMKDSLLDDKEKILAIKFRLGQRSIRVYIY